MARKTNKTNHVLGLLAGKNEETVDTGAANSDRRGSAEQADGAAPAPNVQIVAKQEEDDAIADTVKQLLEEELEAEEFVLPEPTKAAVGEEIEDEAEEIIEEEIEETIEEDTEAYAPVNEEPVTEETVKREVEEMQDIADETKLSEDAQKELERLEKEAKTAATESDYVFLNVMEQLVRDIADKYIKQFGTCTCSRCKADVIALALTNLPPKYEVVARNAAAPLMNFYSQQFAGAVTVEVTKACTQVRERPHHNRD